MKRTVRNFVNGSYADATDGRTADLISPVTGEAFGTAPVSGQADVDAAFEAAANAFEGWRDTTPGERQLALIARALSGEPRLLVMDEPTASLDFGNQARVLGQIRRLAEAGIAVLFSTHDPGHALLCADRLIALHAGRLVADGPAAATVTPDLLRLIYGIDVVVAPVPGLAAPVCVPVVD